MVDERSPCHRIHFIASGRQKDKRNNGHRKEVKYFLVRLKDYIAVSLPCVFV